MDSIESMGASRDVASQALTAVGVSRRLYERLLAAQPHPWPAYGAEVRRHPYRRVD